jgi:hypothetical protein
MHLIHVKMGEHVVTKEKVLLFVIVHLVLLVQNAKNLVNNRKKKLIYSFDLSLFVKLVVL